MRLWSLHPKYLDAKGLVALWRESLLAKAVLQGKTRGYRNHPQLERWRNCPDPVGSLNGYLAEILAESVERGYRFDKRKVGKRRVRRRIKVARGQIGHEWDHLMGKLKGRDPARHRALKQVQRPAVNALFRIVPGAVEKWERTDR